MHALTALNLFPENFFNCIHKCWYIVFLFRFLSKYFQISLMISSLTRLYPENAFFNFHVFVNVSFIFCYFYCYVCPKTKITVGFLNTLVSQIK